MGRRNDGCSCQLLGQEIARQSFECYCQRRRGVASACRRISCPQFQPFRGWNGAIWSGVTDQESVRFLLRVLLSDAGFLLRAGLQAGVDEFAGEVLLCRIDPTIESVAIVKNLSTNGGQIPQNERQ